jgi:hypothetical protein
MNGKIVASDVFQVGFELIAILAEASEAYPGTFLLPPTIL